MSRAISIKKPIGAAGRALRILALLALVALATPAGAALGFGANFSHTTIDEGKAGLEIYLSAFNTGAASDVDVYLVARTPSGDFYSFRNGDWVRGIAPWLAGFALPADFSLVGSRVTVLPALGAGLYTLYTGLARPGTLDLLYLGEAPFLVVRGGSKGVRLGSLRLSTFNTTGLAGVGTYSEVRGRFIGSDGTLDATRRVLDGIEPALDRCVFNERPLNPFDGAGDLQLMTLDVGPSLLVQAMSDGVIVGKVSLYQSLFEEALGLFEYETSTGTELPAVSVDPALYYTFSAPGGSQLSGFRATVHGVGSLRLSHPTFYDHPGWDVADDLDMRWNGNRGIGEVVVRAHAENHTLHCSVDCRFVDDGVGEIPAFLLQKLWNCGRQSYQAVGGSLMVSRQRYQFFDTLRDELDYGVVSIRSADRLAGYWLGDQ